MYASITESCRRRLHGIKSNLPHTNLFGQYFFSYIFSFFTWSCLLILLPSCPFVCTYLSSVPYLAYFVKKISMRLMLCTNCSRCVISNGLQSLAENTSLSDNQRHHLQLWVLRHTRVPAGKHGCHSSRKGRSNVIENSVCICVTGDTWRCINSHQSGTVGSFGVPPGRTITKTEHYARHTCRALQAIFNQMTVKDFKGGGGTEFEM